MTFVFHAAPRRLRPGHWACALLLLAGTSAATAQSAANGQLLYNKVFVGGSSSCAASACHGSNPSRNLNHIGMGISAYTNRSGVAGIREMQFLAPYLSDADYNDLAAYIAAALGGTPTYIPLATAPAVSLSAAALAFGSVTLGQTSTARSVTLSNTGTAALTVGSIVASGSGFAATHDCPASLAAGSACTVSASFAPTVAGSVTGALTLSSNAAGSPHAVTLSGTGAGSVLADLVWSGATTGLSFVATVGTASATQTLTLQNQGTAPGTLSTLTVTGADAADFDVGGSCGAGVSLSAAASCTVTLSFNPASAGSKLATLQLTSANAANPAVISLAGSATAAGTTPGTGTNANVGGGGCSVAASGRPFDPLLLTLGGLAGLALAWRRWRAG